MDSELDSQVLTPSSFHRVCTRAPKYDLVVLSRTEYEVVLGRTEYEYDRKIIEVSTSQYEVRPFYFKRGRTSTRSYWYEVVLARTTKKLRATVNFEDRPLSPYWTVRFKPDSLF